MAPLNDLAQIKIDVDEFGFGGDGKDTAESGILVALPPKFIYFGFWSFAFENSLGNKQVLEEVYDYYASKIGRRVYWTALSERGNIIQKGNEKFAFLKLTSLICEDDPDSDATSVHSDGAGSFGLEN